MGILRPLTLAMLILNSQNFLETRFLAWNQTYIIVLDKHAPNPAFDMILGVDIMREFGAILNFAESTITIDHHEVIMRPLDAFNSLKTRRRVLQKESRNTQQGTFFPGIPAKPALVAEATDRTMGILDATYEKADLPKAIRKNCSYVSSSEKTKLLKLLQKQVIRENCDHLSSSEKVKLLKLLQKYEESFDGSLGDFQTDPVRLDLNLGAKPYHGKAFPFPHTQKSVFKREVER